MHEHLGRYLVGREIFFDSLQAGDYWDRVLGLITFKLRQAVFAPLTRTSDQLIRLLGLLGLVTLLPRSRWRQVDDGELVFMTLVPVIIAPFIIVAVNFPDLGRLVISS